jgi:hypothetical protein
MSKLSLIRERSGVNMRGFIGLLLSLSVLSACERHATPPPIPAQPAPSSNSVTSAQTAQVLNQQAQQLLMLQAMQQQQAIFQQNMQAYRDANQRMQDITHQQNLMRACQVAGNCEVRLVPK